MNESSTVVTNIHGCNILQEDLLSLTQSEKTWQMQFNVKKCYVMSINHKKVLLLFDYTMYNSDHIHKMSLQGEPYSWSTLNFIAPLAHLTLTQICPHIYS